jgi:hypothetical protein
MNRFSWAKASLVEDNAQLRYNDSPGAIRRHGVLNLSSNAVIRPLLFGSSDPAPL